MSPRGGGAPQGGSGHRSCDPCVWAACRRSGVRRRHATSACRPSVACPSPARPADGTALTLGAHVTDVTLELASRPSVPTASPGGAGSDFLTLDMRRARLRGPGPSSTASTASPWADILRPGRRDRRPGGAPGPRARLPRGPLLPSSSPPRPPGPPSRSTRQTVTASIPGNRERRLAVTFQPARQSSSFRHRAGWSRCRPPRSRHHAADGAGHRPKPRRTAGSANTAGVSPAKAARRRAGAGGGLVVLVLVVPIGAGGPTEADREGRVILDSPPLLGAALGREPGSPTMRAPTSRSCHLDHVTSIVVKLLGWLEIDGLVPPIMAGPRRGDRSCSSCSTPGGASPPSSCGDIWVEGPRSQPQATFRKYMVHLRKLDAGRDLGHDRLPLRADRRGHLGLGHVPLARATGRRPSPWRRRWPWCGARLSTENPEELALRLGRRHRQPDRGAVESTGHELGTLSLESGRPRPGHDGASPRYCAVPGSTWPCACSPPDGGGPRRCPGARPAPRGWPPATPWATNAEQLDTLVGRRPCRADGVGPQVVLTAPTVANGCYLTCSRRVRLRVAHNLSARRPSTKLLPPKPSPVQNKSHPRS